MEDQRSSQERESGRPLCGPSWSAHFDVSPYDTVWLADSLGLNHIELHIDSHTALSLDAQLAFLEALAATRLTWSLHFGHDFFANPASLELSISRLSAQQSKPAVITIDE